MTGEYCARQGVAERDIIEDAILQYLAGTSDSAKVLYLRCGVFAHGFVHAKCECCGHDLLVAFSCKARAVCPSCAGRRMCDLAT
jgi:transposase-like zinc-binding protein